MAAHLLQPGRVDGGDAAPKQARGFHQFGRHNPAPRFFHQMGAGMRKELDAARAQVFARVALGLQLATDVAQQPGQHRQMQLLVACRQRVESPFVFRHHGVQLRVDVAPLAHAAQVDKVLPQQLFILTVRQLVRCGGTALGVVDPLPEFQVTAEFAFLVIKFGMGLIRLGLCFHRAVAHVLHAQRRRDHQHFVQCTPGTRLQDHAADTRVQRQLGQFLTDGGQLVVIIDGAQFRQQLVAVGNGTRRGSLDERKVFHHTEVQRLHAQNHAGQGTAQNFRIGKAWP